MGNRIKKGEYILIGIIGMVMILILLMVIINFVKEKIYEYSCNHVPITDAWKDNKCREYFYKEIGESK